MRLPIFYLILALSWLSPAQSFKLTYQKTANINGKEISLPFNYILESNDAIAAFYPENEDEKSYFKLPQEQGLTIFKDFGDSAVFFDKETNLYMVEQIFNPAGGAKLTLINVPLPSWEITNVTKQIGDFMCYKAIATGDESFANSTQTIVWFTPTPSIKAGPAQFCNLPGMVVAVEESTINAGYQLLKVESTTKISHRTSPKEELKKVNSQEHFKAVERMYKEFQKN
jgi:GLPGLI family protein